MSSEPQVALKLFIEVPALATESEVSNIYYSIRVHGDDGRTEIRKVDCRNRYAMKFSKVSIAMTEHWFMITCSGSLAQGIPEGVIMHPISSLLELGVEYFGNNNKNQ